MSQETRKNQSRRAMLAALGGTALSAGMTYPMTAAPNLAPAGTEIKHSPSAMTLANGTWKAGTYVSTLGYYRPGDGGGALYEITTDSTQPYSLSLNKGLYAVLIHPGFVNYQMFGTKCDGVADDGIAIKAAHEFANAHRIPVINPTGEYWLKQTKLIPVKTNVIWGSSIFHIDESLNSPKETHFEILPDSPPEEVQLSADQKSALIARLKPGTQMIPELAAYKNCLIIVKDENDRIGRRFGADYNPRGWAREDFFYVEEHGRIIGDIAWTFQDYTNLIAYPCSQSFLTVEGGTFLLSGDNPGALGGPYHQAGITTRRSRTIIRNQWMGLEKGKTDLSLTPRSGFYTFSHVYDILLENIRLIPWEKDRPGTDRDLKAGTYGIGGSRVLNGTFRNITAEGSPEHWGVFGTNLYKNFTIEKCRLNRVDVHFHGWNITIKDSEIGQKGLTLTGGGDLLIENTRVFNNVLLNFRPDYGAKWDGPIRVKSCKLIVQTGGNASLISMMAGDFDYKYPVVFGQHISVDDVTFVSKPEWDNAKYIVLNVPSFSSSKEGGRFIFPERMEFSNLSVAGRNRGLRLFQIKDLSSYLVRNRPGGLVNGSLNTNSVIEFRNITLDPDSSTHNLILGLSQPYQDVNSLYPEIMITNCSPLRADLGDAAASVRVTSSRVAHFSAGKTASFKGQLYFDSCQLTGISTENGDAPFTINADAGVGFNFCEINLPQKNGQPAPELLDTIGFLKLNERVRFNHMLTRLGPDIVQYLSAKGTKLKPRFIEMLKCHHELESEVV